MRPYLSSVDPVCSWRLWPRFNDWKEFLIGTVLYKTKSLDGTKPNTNSKTNPNPNTNPIQLFNAFFQHRPMIFKLASFVRFSHRSNTVLLPRHLGLNSFSECFRRPMVTSASRKDVLGSIRSLLVFIYFWCSDILYEKTVSIILPTMAGGGGGRPQNITFVQSDPVFNYNWQFNVARVVASFLWHLVFTGQVVWCSPKSWSVYVQQRHGRSTAASTYWHSATTRWPQNW